ncbi:MAG TPA: AraC family transcriptional regulator [Steroidobacteraceae bacterium]|nr:AraC family transcriptional regulator [Steroidobacteraceae bacterium]
MAVTTMAGAGSSRFEIAERPVVGPPELQCGPHADAVHSPFASRYLAYRYPLRFASEDAGNRCDTYYLSPWMVMAVVDVASSERFESPLQGQDIVELHYRVSGAIEIEGSWGECRFSGPAWLLWFQPQGCDDASEQLGEMRARETWVSLYCDRGWLRRVAERAASHLDLALEDAAEGRATPRFRVGPHLAATVPLLRDILGANREDPLHWLYASAKANELLYATLSHMPGYTPEVVPCRLTLRDRRQLQSVRDLLASDFASPPRLPALARQAGMNYSKLCSGFRQLFGETTTEFVRRRRLEMAHELLRTTDLQVQQIARRVGYAHHGSFTAAFVHHFGCSPKSVSRTPR